MKMFRKSPATSHRSYVYRDCSGEFNSLLYDK